MSDAKRCTHGRNFCLECHDEKDAAAALLVECERLRKERDQLRAELEAIRGQQPDTWPKLDKPAKVGSVRFNPGLSARLVVEAAQRQHEYSQQPEVEAARLERFKRAMREFHGERPDAVSVPSDTALRRAAKFLAGIDNGCNEVKTLRALVENAQGIGAVSVPRELLDKLLHAEAEHLHGQFEEALESLRALSTKNAEEV